MHFVSTRDASHRVGLSEAIARGLAPDGGLYVPEGLPRFTPQDFDGAAELAPIAERLLAPFAQGDLLGAELAAVCAEAFDFPAPVAAVQGAPGPASVLELFHGPTSAFKDFGARFLAASLARIRAGGARKLTILVATSGDTGGAVAAAFHRRSWAEVVILYPKGLVSARQAHQLACWGDNVRTYAVRGSFDDCQRLVKEAFVDDALRRTHELSSANSINIGRLLPQVVYYARASLALWRATGAPPSFIVPSGNLGNALACVLARRMGLPVGDIVLATNANLPLTDFFRTGRFEPRPSVATLASAMDVGNPSNLERLRALYGSDEALRREIGAVAVSDEEIRETIRGDAAALGRVWCPHTATAACVYRQLAAQRGAQRWVIVATAHPAKFDDIVEPLVGHQVPVPPALGALLARPSHAEELPASLAALRVELAR